MSKPYTLSLVAQRLGVAYQTALRAARQAGYERQLGAYFRFTLADVNVLRAKLAEKPRAPRGVRRPQKFKELVVARSAFRAALQQYEDPLNYRRRDRRVFSPEGVCGTCHGPRSPFSAFECCQCYRNRSVMRRRKIAEFDMAKVSIFHQVKSIIPEQWRDDLVICQKGLQFFDPARMERIGLLAHFRPYQVRSASLAQVIDRSMFSPKMLSLDEPIVAEDGAQTRMALFADKRIASPEDLFVEDEKLEAVIRRVMAEKHLSLVDAKRLVQSYL